MKGCGGERDKKKAARKEDEEEEEKEEEREREEVDARRSGDGGDINFRYPDKGSS